MIVQVDGCQATIFRLSAIKRPTVPLSFFTGTPSGVFPYLICRRNRKNSGSPETSSVIAEEHPIFPRSDSPGP